MGVNGIYGLSGSGMDIESMVKVGMMSKQNEYDKMAQKFTKNEWMKANYIELNNKITTFNASTLSQYKMSNTMNAKGAESSSEAVKVSASSTADLMSHQVDVEKLSSNAYLVGTNGMKRYGILTKQKDGTADQTSIKLADVLFSSLKVESNGIVSGRVSGVHMTADARSDPTWSQTGNSNYDQRGIVNDNEPVGLVNGRNWYRYERYEQYEQYVQWKNDSDGTISTTEPGDTTGWIKNVKAALESTDNPDEWMRTAKAELVAGVDDSSKWHLVKSTTKPSDSDAENWTTIKSTSETSGESWRKITYSTKIINGVAQSSPPNDENWNPAYEDKHWQFSNGIKIDDVAFEFTIGDGTTKVDADGKVIKNEVTISYKYSDLLGDEETEGKTFNDLVADINKQSNGLNIKASYDSVHDRFSFVNTKSGEDNGIEINFGTDPTNQDSTRSALVARNFFNNMGLLQSKNGLLYNGDNEEPENTSNTILFDLKNAAGDGINSFMGENGIMRVDGITYDDVVDNKLTINGITYTAVKTTGTLTEIKDPATGKVTSRTFDPTEPAATIAVTQDADAIIDKVKSFITDYNKLLADLYAKYDEKPNSDYKPLTQSQKDQMKEEQITKWEEKAKAGMLYHDQTLGKIIMNMRNAVAEKVEGIDSKYDSIFGLGISTTGLKGQLVLDEDKLKKALAEDPDAVYNVFAKLDSQNLDDSAKSGVAQRLGDIFVSANKAIKDRAGSTSDITEDSDLNNLLRNLQTKMSNFKKLMSSFENALYKKYDAMESTLAKLGAQLNYIMGGQS
ncbi:MAG: flagellar filament capping protein FliD [Quinella sp. 1Q5]|nr:flagellar filament capping protein FliD [Quinella sp. 1Q5]